MFEISSKQPSEPQSYLRQKKRLFQQQIRRQHKTNIFFELREQALMPQKLSICLNDLPQKLESMFEALSEIELVPPIWLKIVSDKLSCLIEEPKSVFNPAINPQTQISGLCLVLAHHSKTSEEFNQIWELLETNSQDWSQLDKRQLLRPLGLAIAKIDIQHIKKIKKVLQRMNKRFDLQMLQLFDFILKKCPQKVLNQDVLSSELLVRMVEHMGFAFYGSQQRVTMCEILIQVLYLSDKATVAEKWDLNKLFNILHTIIGFSSESKLMIERSLLLIFNVNIDMGSKRFVSHPCCGAILQQMQNTDLPKSIRVLMAETFLSSLINISRSDLPKYIKNHSKMFQGAIRYIIQAFPDSATLIQCLEDVLKIIFQLQQNQAQFVFRNWLLERPQLLESLCHSAIGKDILYEHSLL